MIAGPFAKTAPDPYIRSMNGSYQALGLSLLGALALGLLLRLAR